jgi:hypothetical protein
VGGRTSGSDSSMSVSSISIASQTPIRARFLVLKSTLALILKATVCFSGRTSLSAKHRGAHELGLYRVVPDKSP